MAQSNCWSITHCTEPDLESLRIDCSSYIQNCCQPLLKTEMKILFLMTDWTVKFFWNAFNKYLWITCVKGHSRSMQDASRISLFCRRMSSLQTECFNVWQERNPKVYLNVTNVFSYLTVQDHRKNLLADITEVLFRIFCLNVNNVFSNLAVQYDCKNLLADITDVPSRILYLF